MVSIMDWKAFFCWYVWSRLVEAACCCACLCPDCCPDLPGDGLTRTAGLTELLGPVVTADCGWAGWASMVQPD